MPPVLTIRPPLAWRIVLVATLLAAVLGVGLAWDAVFTAMDREVRYVAVLAVVGVLWAVMCIRTVLLKVEVGSDGRLTVRGTLSTDVFRPEEVRAVRLTRAGLAGGLQGHWLVLDLADGRELRLEATATWPLPGRRRAQADVVGRLNAWAAAGSG
jgi:hypothetical protein